MIVPLRSRRRKRALAVQKLQHLIPAVGLITAGVETLRRGAGGFELGLALVEVIASAVLLAIALRALRADTFGSHEDEHDAHGVDWVDISAAGILLIEAAERWHLHHHIAGPIILTAAATLGIGLFHRRLAARASARRSLHVTDEHVSVRRPFWNFVARWGEIASIEIGEDHAEIRRCDGRRRRFSFADLENADAVRAALAHARERLQP